MKNKASKSLILLLAVVMLGVVVAPASAKAAGGQIYSDVNRKIVGMWVEVKDGSSGWAWMDNNYSYESNWHYDTQGKEWRVHVGLGGNAGDDSWDKTVISPWKTTQSDSLELIARSGIFSIYIYFK